MQHQSSIISADLGIILVTGGKTQGTLAGFDSVDRPLVRPGVLSGPAGPEYGLNVN